MLEAVDLSCGYSRDAVVNRARFSMAPGEFHCLLGPNGSGKTAFFKTLAGLLKPLSGSIRADGVNLLSAGPGERAELLAFVPQHHAPVFPFAVTDVVVMGRAGRRPGWAGPSSRDWDAVAEALETTGMADFAQRPYSQLSGGERQMVMIARAIAQGARYLILDEPASGLDFANQTRTLRLLGDLARSGRGILMSSHHPEHALRHASRVETLSRGVLTLLGSPAESLDGVLLEKIYGIPFRVVSVDGRAGPIPVCVPEA